MSDRVRAIRTILFGISLGVLHEIPAAVAQKTSSHSSGNVVCSSSMPAVVTEKLASTALPKHPSPKEIREADDLYLEGAQQFNRKNFDSAQRSFERAVRLNPENHNYTLALLFTRETRLTGFVQEAAKARLAGESQRANSLLVEGCALDPTNPLIAQHFDESRTSSITQIPVVRDGTLAAPTQFAPLPGKRSFHLRGDLQDIIRGVYNAFGIEVTFDSSLPLGVPVRFDIDDVDFSLATEILGKMGGIFGVPIQPSGALVAKDTRDRRDALMPLAETTIFLPGETAEEIRELANLARNLFGLQQVAVSTGSGSVVLRGEESSLKVLSETYKEITDNRSDVLLDLTLYEIDRANARDIGFVPPTSATAIDVATAAQSLITSNQTLLNESISSGALTLSGSSYAKELEEVEYLVAAGVSGSSTFTGLLGTLGSYQGVPLAGISVSSATINLLLSSSDARTLEAIKIRASNTEPVVFRVGSRYPILTSLSTSTTGNAVATALAAAGVNSATIATFGGTTSTTTVPQIQFEDLGLTLKTTARVMDGGKVRLALDLRIEAIAGTGVDGIPILTSHTLASTITVLAGETTMLAVLVDTNETKAVDGAPDLSDLPGFQATDRSTSGIRNELLITITPHIVSTGSMRVTNRRLVRPRLETLTGADASSSSITASSTTLNLVN